MNDKTGTLEGLRQLVRHYYVLLVTFCAILVVIVAVTTTLHKAVVVGLAFYPLLTSAWYYSTPDMVHGPKFRDLSRNAKINTCMRIAGLFMSAAAFSYTLPTLF